MICLCVEDDSRVRIEAPNVPNPPHLRPVQVWLCNGEQDQQGDSADQLEWHQPEHGCSLPPLADKGLVAPIPLRVPAFER